MFGMSPPAHNNVMHATASTTLSNHPDPVWRLFFCLYWCLRKGGGGYVWQNVWDSMVMVMQHNKSMKWVTLHAPGGGFAINLCHNIFPIRAVKLMYIPAGNVAVASSSVAMNATLPA